MAKNPFVLFTYAGAWERWWFPLIVYLGAITLSLSSLFFEERRECRPLLLLSLTGIFFFVIALGRSDYEHWQKATPFFWVVLCLMAGNGISSKKVIETALGIFCVIFMIRFIRVDMLIGAYLNMGPQKLYFPKDPIPLPGLERLGPVAVDQPTQKRYRDIQQIIHRYAPAGKSVFNFTDEPLHLYLSDNRNATRTTNISFVVGTVMEQKAIDDLITAKPSCVLAIQSGKYLLCKPWHSAILDFVMKNYRVVEHYDEFVFLVPR